MTGMGIALAANGQTNALEMFAMPGPGLRVSHADTPAAPEKALLDEIGPDIRSVPAKTTWQGGNLRSELLIASGDGDDYFRHYFMAHGNSGLEKPIPPLSPVVHALDTVFRPAEIRIGRTSALSCSLWTAIQRKNPLCLLNPIVFNISF